MTSFFNVLVPLQKDLLLERFGEQKDSILKLKEIVDWKWVIYENVSSLQA